MSEIIETIEASIDAADARVREEESAGASARQRAGFVTVLETANHHLAADLARAIRHMSPLAEPRDGRIAILVRVPQHMQSINMRAWALGFTAAWTQAQIDRLGLDPEHAKPLTHEELDATYADLWTGGETLDKALGAIQSHEPTLIERIEAGKEIVHSGHAANEPSRAADSPPAFTPSLTPPPASELSVDSEECAPNGGSTVSRSAPGLNGSGAVLGPSPLADAVGVIEANRLCENVVKDWFGLRNREEDRGSMLEGDRYE